MRVCSLWRCTSPSRTSRCVTSAGSSSSWLRRSSCRGFTTAGIQGRLLLGGAALVFAILYWWSGGKRAPLPRLPLYAVGVAAGVLLFESVLHGTKFQTALQVPVICAAGLILGACVAQSGTRAFLALALFMAPLALLAVAEIAGLPQSVARRSSTRPSTSVSATWPERNERNRRSAIR